MRDARAGDGAVAALVFGGDPAVRPGERVGPAFASEIETREPYLYGTFRARLQPAACGPTEEAVSGFFTYFNDGSDANGNGIADNAEIDIELLCGTPHVVSLTAWTDYQPSPERFVKWTRSVDLATGDYFESASDHEYGLVFAGNAPQLKHPGFPDPEAFYEMGFEWRPNRLRYFMTLGGGEVTLWELTNTRYIPQRPAYWMFNVWHPAGHWFGDGGAAGLPARDAVLSLDWARYWSASAP